MVHHSALCLIMEVAALFWTLTLLIATFGVKVNATVINSQDNTHPLHFSEAQWTLSNVVENSQLNGKIHRIIANHSEKTPERENILWRSSLARIKRSDSLTAVFPEELKSPSDVLNAFNTVRDSALIHHRRHNHSRVPSWLKDKIKQSANDRNNKIQTFLIEEGIAAVFRGVAYGKKDSSVLNKKFPHTGNRYERTTALSETPDYNYVADESLLLMSGRRTEPTNASSVNKTKDPFISVAESVKGSDSKRKLLENGNVADLSVPTSKSTIPKKNITTKESSLQILPEQEAYDNAIYISHEDYSSDFYSDDISKISRRGDSLLASNVSTFVDKVLNNITSSEIGKSRIPRLSWFDYLLCTNRNMTWMFINFLLGFVLLGVSIFAPYRLLTLRSCTHILPRTHFVTVHLLVFIAASLKALYMFHLAFGGREKLPLVLILILTNSSIPCFISAYLILIVMMFLTADVQVYKPKFLTMKNISIFIVMMLILSFLADIIVGTAHSKSVLILSRVMLIGLAVTVIVFYIKKYPRVIHVVHLLKREFQGELKLLVAPSKDSPQQKQMNIKYILRNRLHSWCRIMNFATFAVGICCLIHFIHAIFLISSHVPAWVWWGAHASGASLEAAVGVLLCIASALTQRYDENASFVSDFFVPSSLKKKKRRVVTDERNGNVIYQRVSYSSGTESTQYTTCPNERVPAAGVVVSRTPKPPRRRTATVRRSATFSYGPQYPRGPGRPCQPPVPNLNVMRTGSTSQIPIYNVGSLSPVSDIYSPASISHVPVFSPESARSMLVHEDGFVRIRSQVYPNEAIHRRSGSHTGIHNSHQYHHGSNPQIHNANIQQWNGYGSRESFYHCLPRKRRSSRSSSFRQHNSQIAETDYYSETPERLPIDHVYVLDHADQRTMDPNYHSFSHRRHGSRESSLKQLNNTERENDDYEFNRSRRPSSRGVNLQHMNNLDRSEENYQSLGRRKLSHDDNNDPIYYNSSHEGSYHKLPSSKNNSQYSKLSPMNLNDRDAVSPVSHHSDSPSIRHKISNLSGSPAKNIHSPSPVHSSPVTYSPVTSRREAVYPKPFAHRGSNSSLRSEDIPYLEHYQRTNPVRRNHSSAGYFPSRCLQPMDASDDTQRYGSLRIGLVKKRQPGYVLHTNTSKILNKYLDKYPRAASEEDSKGGGGSEYGVPNKVFRPSDHFDGINKGSRGTPENKTIIEGDNSEADTSQSAANTSKGSDADWALDVITSSSILTDFYSLKRPKKKKEGIAEEEEETPVAKE